MTRVLALLAVASAAAWGQFNSLATPSDGSAVYFTTALRLKDSLEPTSGKVFAADEHGVRMVVGRWLRRPALPANYSGNCVFGQLYSFSAVELSGDGKMLAAAGQRFAIGECHGSGPWTLLRTPAGSRDYDGLLRISASGQWAVLSETPNFYQQTTASILNLKTGARTDFSFPELGPSAFAAAGRTIADDGTTIFVPGRAFLGRPGGTAEPFNAGFPLAISANGSHVLYAPTSGAGLHVLDLHTGEDVELTSAANAPAAGISDDGSRAGFLLDGQLYVAGFDGAAPRQVSSESDGLASATLSGNGKIAYAVTATGRLVKIAVDTGESTEIVGRTPDIVTTGVIVDAGSFANMVGHGFADQAYTASPPLPLTLGGVTVTVDGRAVPLSHVTPTAIDALIPWDMASGAPRTVVVNSSMAQTPFEAPQGTLQIGSGPRAGALYQQDWTPVNKLTVHAGQIIHVYAVGLGPVSPEVTPGTLAPSTEPLARVASPMSCSNATVLFAGLQPGALARVYQVDLQIGSQTGYQMFSCKLGSGGSFAFLTLNVVP